MSSRFPESMSSLSANDSGSMTSRDRSRAIEAMKSMYKSAQQAEYLHLQAETELLLQQLQALQQRRLAVPSGSSSTAVSAHS